MDDNPVDRYFEDRDGPLALASDPNVTLSEDLIADIFVRFHGDGLRYDHHAGKWYAWTGACWRRDDTGATFEKVRKVARCVAQQAPKDSDATKFLRAGAMSGAERIAQCDQRVAVTSEAWDGDPFLLGTPDATVDLRTGACREPDPGDGITKIAAVAPAVGAQCPLWLDFLADTTGHDAELVAFLQRVCGYALTGSTREHALFFVYGPGGNGKSVFLNTVARIMGDYVATSAMDTFAASRGDRHPTDLAMLKGARLVSVSETEEGQAWAESRIKQLTGGDPISARHMRQDFFTFQPQFKLLIVGNHKPILRNVDAAARRRFRLIPFERTPTNPDRALEAKLKAEWPAILRWMIDGALAWQREGLEPPDVVKRATDEYFEAQDTFGAWLEERCTIGANEFDAVAKLFGDWSEYAKRSGEPPQSKKGFSEALVKRGFALKRTRSERQARGLALKFDPAASGIDHG
jgi:putative DNA primase/helicase